MVLKKFIYGTKTFSNATNSLSVSGFDFTPTNAMIFLVTEGIKTDYYNVYRISNLHYLWQRTSSLKSIRFDIPETTYSYGNVTWTNQSGKDYRFPGDKYFYVIWREE